jgi:ABC-type nitrate/sulfonate/bicarbonate transport system substrate-binding protein
MQMIPNARTTNRYTAIANLVFVALTVLGLVFPFGIFALDQVYVHVSAGISPNTLLYRFTKEKGFYREEGLDALLIQAGMLPGIQGLVGGSFHFSQILGQGAGGILRGLPLKIVMVFDTRPLNWLYASKNIKTIQDLKGGKQIAVSSFGAALDQMTRELLSKHGIDPQRDVALRAIEPTPSRLAALLTGAVDAAVLNQLDRLIAKKNGFNELLFYGDDLEFVTAGVVVAEKTLAQRPDLVQRFLRGTLRGFLWLKSNEKEAVQKFAAAMKISESEAGEVYKAALNIMSADGTIPRNLQEKMIAFQRRSLKIEREVVPEQVYDFGMIRALNDEMRKSK